MKSLVRHWWQSLMLSFIGLSTLRWCVRRKTSSQGRPASCSCTCETVMVPATPGSQPQQQQPQQQETPAAHHDYQMNDWTGDGQATGVDDDAGYDDIGDNFVAGQSLIDDTYDIDRQVQDVARPTPDSRRRDASTNAQATIRNTIRYEIFILH